MFMFVGGEVKHTAFAVFGAILFSCKSFSHDQYLSYTQFFLTGFIIFDTQMIMTRVSPEEYILATIELYLDIINLFIEILKLVARSER